MADSSDQISVSLSNPSVIIASGDELDVTDVPAIIWTADETGHDVNISISNAGWITDSASNSLALDGDPTLIYGKLTFNNKSAGEIDVGLSFSGLTDAASVKIVNSGSIGDDDGNSALDLSTDGASFSITNKAGATIGGSGTWEGISNASNTVIENYGAITVGEGRALVRALATRVMSVSGGAAISLGDGTNDTIDNHAGGYIDGGRYGIYGQSGGVTISNDAGALIHASSGPAILFSTDPVDDGVVTIDNAGEIIGNSRVTAEDAKAPPAAQLRAELVRETNFIGAPGAIGISGRLHLVNSGLITEAGVVPHSSDTNLSAAIAAGGGSIVNHGLIIGTNVGIETVGLNAKTKAADDYDAFAPITIKNDGLIQGGGDGAIVLHGNQNDTLTNSGHIVGNVDMGAGNDYVKLTNGSDIDGNILLGDGNDTFKGSAAAEDIYGGKGADSMTGGGGADTFHFASGDSGKTAMTIDTITDFTAIDTLDLHAIDANKNTKGNNKFTFIGTDAFDGHAGELRYEHKGHDTWVLGDVNGDGNADFKIHLDHLLTLTKDEFVL